MLKHVLNIPTPSRLSKQMSNASRSITTIPSEGRFFPKTTAESLLRKASSSSSEQVHEHPAYNKIAFLGVGKMAQAILSPVISTGLQPANQVCVFDKSDKTLDEVVAQNPGVQTANSISDLVSDADLVICAVKPQNINVEFLTELRESPNRPDHGTFMSVIAGVPLDLYRPAGYDKIVRAMPNTPAMIGQGMTVWCCTPNLTATERDRTHQVLECLGESVSTTTNTYTYIYIYIQIHIYIPRADG
jgi:pyrroline-5-carboxylate reductase